MLVGELLKLMLGVDPELEVLSGSGEWADVTKTGMVWDVLLAGDGFSKKKAFVICIPKYREVYEFDKPID